MNTRLKLGQVFLGFVQERTLLSRIIFRVLDSLGLFTFLFNHRIRRVRHFYQFRGTCPLFFDFFRNNCEFLTFGQILGDHCNGVSFVFCVEAVVDEFGLTRPLDDYLEGEGLEGGES